MIKGRASGAALLLFLPLLVSASPLTNLSGSFVSGQDAAGTTLAPIVAKHCVSCHGAKKPKADLDLTPFTTEASVRAKGKLWQLAARMVRSHEMPPADKKPTITGDERERFAKAVETILLRVDPKAPVNPGRVTIRRLNRAEYRNTMRDLLGVDFDPAEDFPSDDIGHGFDNIGDVLSLPPVLMERYLTAAEAVVQRAFPAEPPKPTDQHTGAKYLQPSGKSVPQSKFRPVSGGRGDAVQTGPLYNEYRIRPDGEYVFRFRAYAKPKGVKVAVLACGKDVPSPASDAEADRLAGAALRALRPFRIVETVAIDHDQEKGSKRYEVKIPPMAGVDKIALAVVKAPDGKPAPEVHVESFILHGPLDPRPPFQRETLKAVEGKPKPEQTRELLRTFTARAWRRPVSDEELGRLVQFVERSEAGGARWEGALGLAMQAVLCSPKFLFRAELDDRPQLPQAHPVTEHQLASRLSYFLWQSMPDDELLALAGKGQLTANLEKQVRRMLKDPRADALVDGFAMQWLQLQRLSTAAPDPKMFPQFQYLRSSMRRETELFVQSVFREDRSVLDLVTADYTFLDERLARFYGIKDTAGNRDGKPKRPGGQPIPRRDFVRVQLADGDRGGLLTHASILTVTSNPTRTSPVKRGRWVLEQILGEPPPPPPPDVPELEETAEAQKSGSLKQRLEQHRRDPRCANCHARMDAIGFALENFDPIGAYRWKDGSFDIDASGAFPDGTVVKGATGLREVVKANKDLFVRCLVEKMLTFALGRGVEPYDAPAVRKIQEALAGDGHKVSRLVVEIVKSDPFRLRRGTAQTD